MGTPAMALAEGPFASVQPANYVKAVPTRYKSVPNGRGGDGVGKQFAERASLG